MTSFDEPVNWPQMKKQKNKKQKNSQINKALVSISQEGWYLRMIEIVGTHCIMDHECEGLLLWSSVNCLAGTCY